MCLYFNGYEMLYDCMECLYNTITLILKNTQDAADIIVIQKVTNFTK